MKKKTTEQTSVFLIQFKSGNTLYPWRVLKTLKQAERAIANRTNSTSVCTIREIEYGVRKGEK